MTPSTTTTSSAPPALTPAQLWRLKHSTPTSQRWAVQPDPAVWVRTAERPLHALVADSLEVGQAMLRASILLHRVLSQDGFAMGQTVRSMVSTSAGSKVTDAFLLGHDEVRLQGCLQLEILDDGTMSSTLLLESAIDPNDSKWVAKVRIFEASQPLGQLSWSSASLGPDSYSRPKLQEQLVVLTEPDLLLPSSWKLALLDALIL